jgi:hypothetical protein
MTALSILRACKIWKSTKNYKRPSEVNRWDIIFSICIVSFVIIFASFFAVIPLIREFEDLFVNGIYYGEENTLFIGAPGKSKHIDILKEYYGRLTISGSTLDWNVIKNLVFGMFSKDYTGIEYTELHFYGNDAVCLFKYFTTLNDPQHIFVWCTLSLHVLCLGIISISYMTVWQITVSSSADLIRSGSKETHLQKQIKKRNLRLQRKVSLIIVSNLACWVPFVLVSILHATEVIDANPFYPVVSLFLLPINSVINPIILNDLIVTKLHAFMKMFKVAVPRHKPRWLKPRIREEANPEVKGIEKGDVREAQPMAGPQHVAQATKDKEIISKPSPEPNIEEKLIDKRENDCQPSPEQNREAQVNAVVDNVCQAKNLQNPNLEAPVIEKGVRFCQPLPIETIDAVVMNAVSYESISEPSCGYNQEQEIVEVEENNPELLPRSNLEEKLNEAMDRVTQLSPQTCLTAHITEEVKNYSEIISESNFEAQEVMAAIDSISQLIPEPKIWAHEIFLVEEVDSNAQLSPELN